MQRILRAARYDPQTVLIGEAPAPAAPEFSRLHRPPPPLPPPIAAGDDPYDGFDELSALAGGRAWGSDGAWDGQGAPAAADTAVEPHPSEDEALQKLADAEQLLAQAAAEAETRRADAAAEAEAMRA